MLPHKDSTNITVAWNYLKKTITKQIKVMFPSNTSLDCSVCKVDKIQFSHLYKESMRANLEYLVSITERISQICQYVFYDSISD